ncbi:hypothetical protein AN931_23130 [Mycobacterium intracellulare subsp. chimaera]|uniref:hypothetical protein n=1 Tax=Mycobacterium intracellulare TaxID=1767 RepID=UPI0006CA86E9|nr:hypothetical protein [Mycobacterium intracellulare]KPN48877.1 hypothetical protein AN931_23130 [Mycobacterium intracellulare subsp. chimaera]KPN48989.1 hypothetical protein AN933_22710 [Mycobacterium intracellulare subsp. chimaera]MDM3909138.1 hypothetical protein [Mycobacterium intracellulare subsp. chimaera]
MTKSTTEVAFDDIDHPPAAETDNQSASPAETSANSTGCEADVAQESTNADDKVSTGRHTRTWVRVLGLWILPPIALLLGLGAAYLKYQGATASAADRARIETVQVATESTIAMLSYTPDKADAQLTAASERLTGTFRDSYTELAKEVVVPGAQQKHISAAARVPAAASVSASSNHSVVMVFVDQVITVGNDAPTDTASVVQVTLDKIGNRWLISGFEPK